LGCNDKGYGTYGKSHKWRIGDLGKIGSDQNQQDKNQNGSYLEPVKARNRWEIIPLLAL
jgi:hypothetical protein